MKGKAKPIRLAFKYGQAEIPFALEFRDRKSLAITIGADLKVRVVAPKDKPVEEVLARVKKKAKWILRKKDYFLRFHPLTPPRQYVSGETHIYLGRQYRLKVVQDQDEMVKLRGKYLFVYGQKRPRRVKELLGEWYQGHATMIFTKHLEECYRTVKKYGITYPKVQVRKMQKRWGSCSQAGNILLNTELVKAPIYCIEYVIMHELCHLKERNHTKSFYKLLYRCMPDWEMRKKRLAGC